MVKPIVRSHSSQEHAIEDSTGDTGHSPLDDSGIQTDTWNSVQDNFRTDSSLSNDDLEGAVGYSPNSRAVPDWSNIRTQRRQSYWEGYSGPVDENRFHPQRRHSSGELSGSPRSYETYIGHSHSNQFGPGESQAGTQFMPRERRANNHFRPQERRGSNQSGYGMTETYNTWSPPEILTHNHNHFTTQYIYPPGIPRETVIFGAQLYTQFLYDEIRRRNLQAPECLDPNHANPPPLWNNDIIHIGNSLRQVANEFAHSVLRRRVQERAESVCLESLNFNTFSDLLFGLFQYAQDRVKRISSPADVSSS
ncbi:uncharacterized protein LOC111865768 isoform X4 [Cryptotermes secundus]|uniref:uncharacterized protein LOC111865768 isoform X4 n=1 Tax=Cryptotermes secundus TaxID=105785 RepID=UPI000CD7B28C|nr:uncharacterized protein LOC111865768 isoform X4 [Cryptotermes secundus]